MDEFLVRRAKEGDRESFAQMILLLKDQAYRIAFCYLKNEADSMDAVCNAMEKAFRNIRKLREPRYFSTWFIRIVINECKLLMRNKEKTVSLEDCLQLYGQDSIGSDEKIDLESLLKKLPPSDRALIYMKYYMGYTLDEISAVMDMPPGTVKTKIYGSLKIMKNILGVGEV